MNFYHKIFTKKKRYFILTSFERKETMDFGFRECDNILQQLDFYVKNYAEDYIVAINCKSEIEKKGIHSWSYCQKLQHVSAKLKCFRKEWSFRCKDCKHLFKDKKEIEKFIQCPSCSSTIYEPFRIIPNAILIGKNIPRETKYYGKKKKNNSLIWNPKEEIDSLQNILPRQIILLSTKDLFSNI